jgi:hypothetical protein
MAQYPSIAPVELTDDELQAVAGGVRDVVSAPGSFVNVATITFTNSGNNSGNVTNSGNVLIIEE